MASSGNKTVATKASVDKFIESLPDSQQQADSRTLVEMFSRITGQPAVMWGDAMIGFGSIKLTYASGREVEWFNVGFSPRKGKITLYVTFDAESLTGKFPELGKYKTGKGCIYINKLADINLGELERLVQAAHEAGRENPKRSDGKEQAVKVSGDE